jgi:hypothetical protein
MRQQLSDERARSKVTQEMMRDGADFSSGYLLANHQRGGNNGRCHLSGIPLQKGFFPLSQRDFYFINCC